MGTASTESMSHSLSTHFLLCKILRSWDFRRGAAAPLCIQSCTCRGSDAYSGWDMCYRIKTIVATLYREIALLESCVLLHHPLPRHCVTLSQRKERCSVLGLWPSKSRTLMSVSELCLVTAWPPCKEAWLAQPEAC